MQHHLNSEHVDGPGHLCPICSKECVTANELRDHLRQHPMRNSVECKHCDKTFKRQHDFDDHLVAGKCPKTSLRCQSCGATFKQEQKLREHTALCDRHRGFQCEFCSRSFKKIKHLQEHQKEQHVRLILRLILDVCTLSGSLIATIFRSFRRTGKFPKRTSSSTISRRKYV